MNTFNFKKSTFFCMVFLVSVFTIDLTDAVALGGGHLSHEKPVFSISSWLYPIVNFLIFFFLTIYLYKSKITPLLRASRAGLEEYANRSKSILLEAEDQKNKLVARLGKVDQEINNMQQEYLIEGERLSSSIIAQANEEALKIEHSAKRKIENERARFIGEVRDELIERSLVLSKKIISQRLDPELDNRLKREALSVFVSNSEA